MTKIRLLIFCSTIIVVLVASVVAAMYANGYRFDREKGTFDPNGLLVINSEPNGAQVFVDNVLKTATNATIPLAPGSYEVRLKKDGYLLWSKKVGMQKEEVTQINAYLFPIAPSLSAISFAGSKNPIISPDLTKIAYLVPLSSDAEAKNTQTDEKSGLWVLETANLPLGFNREPRKITDGDTKDWNFTWSPDSREIMAETKKATYELDAGQFTSQLARVDIKAQQAKILDNWSLLKKERLAAQLAKLPTKLKDVFEKSTSDITFSPDEEKILYTATASAVVTEGLVPPLPGSSTQTQERNIRPNKKYVYDVKEDRNFTVADDKQITYWMPTSAHLMLPQKDKVIIEDYDGTNKQSVYTGSYVYPYAFPTGSPSRFLILTNFGADSALTNLYSVSLK